MTNTNVIEGNNELCFSMLRFENNRLKIEGKHGDATTAIGDPGEIIITLGNTIMEIPANNIIIDEEGKRKDGTKIKDMKGLKRKLNIMRELKKEVKEKEGTNQLDNSNR